MSELVHRVLFVCTYNRVRSPMAAALMGRLYASAMAASSCGLYPSDELDPIARAVMAEVGADLADHRPQPLNEALAHGGFGRLIALSDDAWPEVEAASVKAGFAAELWPTPDPTLSEGSREMRLEAYRLTRQALATKMAAVFGPPTRPL